MIWISSRDRMPINGQRVWYYGDFLGVWLGRFVIDKSERGREMADKWGVPNTTFHCEEAPGVCDTDDAPYWMPYEEGSERPIPPNQHPSDVALMAAAPELLAALRLARDDLSDLLEVADLTDEGVADTTEVLNKVIAAIAKAEGRADE